jgi:hypothetical protein
VKIAWRCLFAAAFAALVLTPAQAQAPPRSPAAAQAAFEITGIRYHIEGRTRDWILAKFLKDNDLYVGRTFASRADLDSVIADRTQLLLNQRTLETARIEATVEPRAGMPAAVTLDVYTRDSWNLIGLPYFKYDSNSGLLLALRGRDYNFFGTMETLTLNLDYTYTEDQTNEWGAKSSFTLPFEMLGHDWSWDFSGGFTYDVGTDPVNFTDTVNFGLDLETTLGIAIPLWPDKWTLAYTQGFHIIRPDDEIVYTEPDRTLRPNPDGTFTADDKYYNESRLSLGSTIRTGWYLPVVEEVKYQPSVFVDVKYKAEGELSPNYRGFQPGFSHALTAERVDWIGNFRNGASASITNSFPYSLSTDRWLVSLQGDLAGYRAASPWGFSARISGFYTPESVNTTDAAEPIRGVLDNRMEGNVGLFWNSDLTLKVFTIRKFAEAQGSFFFDAALVTDTNRSFDLGNDVKYSVGAEGIGFPLFARAFYIRISLGFDITDFIKSFAIADLHRPEIFVGLGHHY